MAGTEGPRRGTSAAMIPVGTKCPGCAPGGQADAEGTDTVVRPGCAPGGQAEPKALILSSPAADGHRRGSLGGPAASVAATPGSGSCRWWAQPRQRSPTRYEAMTRTE